MSVRFKDLKPDKDPEVSADNGKDSHQKIGVSCESGLFVAPQHTADNNDSDREGAQGTELTRLSDLDGAVDATHSGAKYQSGSSGSSEKLEEAKLEEGHEALLKAFDKRLQEHGKSITDTILKSLSSKIDRHTKMLNEVNAKLDHLGAAPGKKSNSGASLELASPSSMRAGASLLNPTSSASLSVLPLGARGSSATGSSQLRTQGHRTAAAGPSGGRDSDSATSSLVMQKLAVGSVCGSMGVGSMVTQAAHALEDEANETSGFKVRKVYSSQVSKFESNKVAKPANQKHHTMARAAWVGMDNTYNSTLGLLSACDEVVSEDSDWRQHVVAKPNSVWRLCWDVFSMLLICNDIITIPLQFFSIDLPYEIQLFCASFWSLDLIFSCGLGYYHNGKLEMRLHKVFLHYARTWMPFDLMIVSADWSVLVVEMPNDVDTGSGYARTVKSLRVFRTLRSLRLLRLVKMRRVFEDLKDWMASDLSRTMLTVATLIFFVVACNHIIACCWYGVSVTTAEHYPSWIKSGGTFNETAEEDYVSYAYTTALHWSLTQFTPASMEVVPRNTIERTFTVLVIVFALVIFSSFLSTLTSTMTRFQQNRSERDKQFDMLRRFLRDMHVSHFLSVRVQRYLEHTVAARSKRIEIKDVGLLELLSTPLRMDLDQEIYGPVLSWHPFFEQYTIADAGALRKLCNTSLKQIYLSAGDSLFNSGEPAHGMDFLLDGQLLYTVSATDNGHGSHHVDPDNDRQTIQYKRESEVKTETPNLASSRTERNLTSPLGYQVTDEKVCRDHMGNYILYTGSWCCEASLWCEWFTHGTMRATQHSVLLHVDAEKFAELTSSHGRIAGPALQYAETFVKLLNEDKEQGKEINDLPWTDYDEPMDEAFYEYGRKMSARLSDKMGKQSSMLKKQGLFGGLFAAAMPGFGWSNGQGQQQTFFNITSEAQPGAPQIFVEGRSSESNDDDEQQPVSHRRSC